MARRIALLVGLVVIGVVGTGAPQVAGPAPSAHAFAAKRITINLGRQRLRAWENGHVVLVSAVTTGNARLPTPVGYSSIFAKRSPYTFVSPWPPGSRRSRRTFSI